MGKYYVRVTELLNRPPKWLLTDNGPYDISTTYLQIVDAKDELEACIKVWLRLRINAKGSTWIVNETGFDDSDDDIYFNDDPVIKKIDKIRKKRGDGS